MPTSLTTAQEAVFNVSAVGADGSAKPAAFSATVSDYATAYVAVVGGSQLHLVPKKAGTVSITISGHSADGTALPTVTVDFSISNPPVPQATQLIASAPTVKGNDITTPADPGTDTVTGTV